MKPDPIAIIGGGVSGLAAGIHLLRQGAAVSLFEANDTLGGCCSTSSVDGYTFNNGALFVAVPRLLDHAFNRLGMDRPGILPLRRIEVPQATYLPNDTRVTLANQHLVAVDGAEGSARTAVLQTEIERCLARWGSLLQIFTDDLLTQPLSIPHTLAKTWRHLPKLRGSLADELNRQFSDVETRAALAASMLYTGLPAERTPAFLMVTIASLLQDGLFLPHGGMGAISEQLHATFRQLGGHVHTGQRVSRIHIGNGRVRTLSFRERDDLAIDAVISSVGGMNTFSALMDAADVPSSMRRRVLRAPLSHRALGIQLGLANLLSVPAHSVNHVPLMDQQAEALAPQPGVMRWMSYTVPTAILPELAPAGGSIVEMFAPVDPTLPLEAWDAVATARAADIAIAALGRHLPLDIVTRRITSPKDYSERMHLHDGALYGLSSAASPSQQFPHKTPIPGLFLCGQTTYPGFGVATAMFSGIFAADAWLRQPPAVRSHG